MLILLQCRMQCIPTIDSEYGYDCRVAGFGSMRDWNTLV